MTPILKEIHWLPVRHCIVYKILSLIYKAINGAVPGYICDLLNYCTSKGTLRSSSQYPLATKARLKTCGERTFPVAAPGLRNSIPLGIRSCSSIDSFKRRLKTYLFQQGRNPFYFFFFMINMFNYLIIFKLVYSYTYIFVFPFLPFFQLFNNLNVEHHGQ